jgi:hypothetical protein
MRIGMLRAMLLWEYIVLSAEAVASYHWKDASLHALLEASVSSVLWREPTADQLIRLTVVMGMENHVQYLIKHLMDTSRDKTSRLETAHFRCAKAHHKGTCCVHLDMRRFSYTKVDVLRLMELCEPDGISIHGNVERVAYVIAPTLLDCCRDGLKWTVHDDRLRLLFDVAPMLCGLASVVMPRAKQLLVVLIDVVDGKYGNTAVGNLGWMLKEEDKAKLVLADKDVRVIKAGSIPRYSALEFIRGLVPDTMATTLR